MAKPKHLHVVGEQPVDITAQLRAEIEARDWVACHIRGDRSEPVSLPDRVRRVWR